MIKIKKIMMENHNFLQYYTNMQILELLKQKISELDYYKFIKSNSTNNEVTVSLEEYLENNISKNKLLDLIKNFNETIYNEIVSEMIDTVF